MVRYPSQGEDAASVERDARTSGACAAAFPDIKPCEVIAMPHSFEDPAEVGTPTGRAEPARVEVSPEAEPGRSHWVDMRWQGVLGWAVATGLFVYFAVGLTVVAIVMAVVAGEAGAAAGMLALAVVFGLVSWPLVRMAPRYSTRQGFLADGTGITLVQEPKRWFPGRNAHIPWPQVHSAGQDRIVVSGGNGRTVHYVIDIELRDPLRDAGLPTWAAFDGDKVRIRSRKARQAEIVRALRATRPDLLPDG